MIYSIKSIRADYISFLNEYGFTQEFVNTILALETLNTEGAMCKVEVKDSEIEGKGVFTIQDVAIGGYLAMARVDGIRMLAGRYTNHSPTPNAFFALDSIGDLYMEALQNIPSGEEVTINYRQAGKVNGYKK